MSIRVSARGLTVHNNMVLLNEFNNGTAYNIPGGKVEDSESLINCVIREVKEETGVDVNVDCFILIYEYIPEQCNQLYGSQHHISHIYLCSAVDCINTTKPEIPDIDVVNKDNIHTGSRWVAIEDLKNINLVPKINNTLYKILKGDSIDNQVIREGLYND